MYAFGSFTFLAGWSPSTGFFLCASASASADASASFLEEDINGVIGVKIHHVDLIAYRAEFTLPTVDESASMRQRLYAVLGRGWRLIHTRNVGLLSRDLQLDISGNTKPARVQSHLSDTDAFASSGPGNDTVFRMLDNGEGDLNDLQLRLEPVSSFLGPSHALLNRELAAVVCGLTSTSVSLGHSDSLLFAGDSMFYKTDTLRIIGKKLVRMHLDAYSAFSSGRYLACSSHEIESDLTLYNSHRVHAAIPQFMHRNSLYQLVIPFRGANRGGFIKDQALYQLQKQAIHDATCRGSFFTMVGMLHVKYGPNAKLIVDDKIIGGHRGLVSIINKMYLL